MSAAHAAGVGPPHPRARPLSPPRPATALTARSGPRRAGCGGALAGGAAAAAPGDMYLLDGSGEPAPPPADVMPRGTPPRKTVYRISVTMVKKERLAAPGPGGPNPRPARRPRAARSPDAPGRLVEEAEEAAGAEDPVGRPTSAGVFRTFRTRSTGQLELGRLRPCARGPERAALAGSPPAAEEEPGSPAPGSPDLDETRGAPLRRSLSFRHWSGPEAPRGRGRRHSSSGSLAWAPGGEAEAGPGAAPEPAAVAQPASEKRNTLDVGEVLSKNDTLSDLERWERSKSKNRTLDNSDLQRLERARAAAAGPGSASEHRLLRFFSGIFARRDGTPGGGPSPRSGASRARGYFSSLRRAPADAHSSSGESIDGSPRRGGRRGRRWGDRLGLAERAGAREQLRDLSSQVTSRQAAPPDLSSGTEAFNPVKLGRSGSSWLPRPPAVWWRLSGSPPQPPCACLGRSPCRVVPFPRRCPRR